MILKKRYSVFFANANGLTVPDAGLYLAYMSAAHHKHTKSRLTDTAADGKRKLVIEEHLVEGKLSAVVAACEGELSVKALCVNADTHRGYLNASAENVIPEENVSVELPIVVVGRSAVVLFA